MDSDEKIRKIFSKLDKVEVTEDFEIRLRRQIYSKTGFVKSFFYKYRIPALAVSMLAVIIVGVISYYTIFRIGITPSEQINGVKQEDELHFDEKVFEEKYPQDRLDALRKNGEVKSVDSETQQVEKGELKRIPKSITAPESKRGPENEYFDMQMERAAKSAEKVLMFENPDSLLQDSLMKIDSLKNIPDE